MSSQDNLSNASPEVATERAVAEMEARMQLMLAALPPEGRGVMEEVMTFRKSITVETDRGAVLMAAAFLDDKLKSLIERRMVQDRKVARRAFEFNGPLGTFSARINLAYLFGIIPKNAQRDLHTIRAIRNEFAHHAAPLSYDDEKIAPLCDRLVFYGVRPVAAPGTKFRRAVMGLLSYIALDNRDLVPIEAAKDFEIESRAEAYKEVSEVYTRVTGKEYPLKHEHE